MYSDMHFCQRRRKETKLLCTVVPLAVTGTLNETFDDDDFEALTEVKGDRTWKEAILEEFGVAEDGG
jgi:hypothetical protein